MGCRCVLISQSGKEWLVRSGMRAERFTSAIRLTWMHQVIGLLSNRFMLHTLKGIRYKCIELIFLYPLSLSVQILSLLPPSPSLSSWASHPPPSLSLSLSQWAQVKEHTLTNLPPNSTYIQVQSHKQTDEKNPLFKLFYLLSHNLWQLHSNYTRAPLKFSLSISNRRVSLAAPTTSHRHTPPSKDFWNLRR